MLANFGNEDQEFTRLLLLPRGALFSIGYVPYHMEFQKFGLLVCQIF